MSDANRIMTTARRNGIMIPAFNVPYLPMMAPIIQALRDSGTFGLIEVAYIEWMHFEVASLEAVYAEYQQWKQPRCTRLHLDHIPVISEDDLPVDYLGLISRAIAVGYDSVMIDGSKLTLEENINATRTITDIAHAHDVAVEGELGSVLRLGSGPIPPYEDLFAAKQGFTDPEDARRFVRDTQVDWLSVSIGNIHGAISSAANKPDKLEAKLDIDHLAAINRAVGIPLVLHGGSGIPQSYIKQSIKHGIAKMNIGFIIRKPYEALKERSISQAQEAVYRTVRDIITDLEIQGSADRLLPA